MTSALSLSDFAGYVSGACRRECRLLAAPLIAKGTPFIIGRGKGSNIKVAHPEVSRTHVVIDHDEQTDAFFVTDCSTFGTSVNGEPLRRSERTPLLFGDTITIRGMDFTLQPAEFQEDGLPARLAAPASPPPAADGPALSERETPRLAAKRPPAAAEDPLIDTAFEALDIATQASRRVLAQGTEPTRFPRETLEEFTARFAARGKGPERATRVVCSDRVWATRRLQEEILEKRRQYADLFQFRGRLRERLNEVEKMAAVAWSSSVEVERRLHDALRDLGQPITFPPEVAKMFAATPGASPQPVALSDSAVARAAESAGLDVPAAQAMLDERAARAD